MVDIKKLALAGVFALLSVFLFYTLSNAFIPTTIDSAQAYNTTVQTEGYTSQGNLGMTIFDVIMYAFALAPLGIAIKLIVDAVKS